MSLVPLLLLVATISGGYVWNEDFWWYLSSGEAIIDVGRIPEEDPFLLPSENDIGWVYHSWLWTVIVGGLHLLGGMTVVVLLHAVSALALTSLIYTTARTDRFGLTNALWTLLFVVTFRHRLAGKAELATWLLLAVFVLILERAGPFTWKRGLALCALQVLWANLHGGYPLGVFVVACYAVGHFLERRILKRSSSVGPPLWLPILLFLVALADPWLWRERLAPFGFVTGAGSVQPASATGTMLILEWRSPFEIASQHPSFLALWLLATVLGLASFRRVTPLRLSRVFVFAGMVLLGATAIRHISGLAISAALVALLNVSRRDEVPTKSLFRSRATIALSVLLALAAVSLWLGRGGFEAGQSGDGAVLRPAITCSGAADFILEESLPGPVFNDYQLGAYLGYRLKGRQRVYVDSRVLDPKVVREYTEVVQSQNRWRAAESRYGFRTAVLGHYSRIIRSEVGQALVADPGWSLAYVDPLAVVFVKNYRGAPRIAGFDSVLFEHPRAYRWPLSAVQRVFLNDLPANHLVELLGNLGSLGLADLVVQISSEALGRNGARPLILNRRCAAYLSLGRVPEAVSDCAAAYEARSGDPQILALYAVALRQSGRLAQAQRLVERALRESPGDVQLLRLSDQLRR